MVTEVDRACEALIVGGLRAARPQDAIVGEEGTADEGTTGVRWLVDPVDGTTNYLYGIPGFSASIAAEIDGDRAVGVVHDVLHGEVFAAVVGRGATRNGVPIRCSDKADLPTALVATGFAYDPSRRERQAAVLGQVLPKIRDIRRMGAASVDLCSVACGRVDAYYEKGLGPWDLAAGALIASEAGARVGDLDGGAAKGDMVLAAAPALFEPLRALLRAAGARSA
jgi:fructose-1,6-bisphosphatase/inositol monophosphatase family enzyme